MNFGTKYQFVPSVVSLQKVKKGANFFGSCGYFSVGFGFLKCMRIYLRSNIKYVINDCTQSDAWQSDARPSDARVYNLMQGISDAGRSDSQNDNLMQEPSDAGTI